MWCQNLHGDQMNKNFDEEWPFKSPWGPFWRHQTILADILEGTLVRNDHHIAFFWVILTFSTASPWGCTAGENCIFATATTITPINSTNSTQTSTSTPAAGSIVCCDANTGCPAQPAPTACVDMGQYDYNKTCTGSCPNDPMTLKWSETFFAQRNWAGYWRFS
jgi:hypothetical protein